MRQKLLPAVSNITSGQLVQAKLPVPGPTWDKFVLEWGATADPGLTGLTDLKLIADGNTLQEFADADELNELNKFYGRDAITGGGTVANPYRMTLHQRRPEIHSFLELSETVAERLTSLRTGDMKSASIDFKITGAGAFCTVYGEEAPFNAPEPSTAGKITRIKRQVYNAVAGPNELFGELARGKRGGKLGIIAIHLKASDVTAINSLKEAGYNVLDQMPKGIIAKMQEEDGRVPTSAYTRIDFTQNGNMNEVLFVDPDRDFRGNVQKTAGGSLPVIVEYLDSIGSGL